MEWSEWCSCHWPSDKHGATSTADVITKSATKWLMGGKCTAGPRIRRFRICRCSLLQIKTILLFLLFHCLLKASFQSFQGAFITSAFERRADCSWHTGDALLVTCECLPLRVSVSQSCLGLQVLSQVPWCLFHPLSFCASRNILWRTLSWCGCLKLIAHTWRSLQRDWNQYKGVFFKVTLLLTCTKMAASVPNIYRLFSCIISWAIQHNNYLHSI